MARKQQTGFTIIELVMVIVILGILAAIALPKYVDLQIDARKAKLNGAIGAVKSAVAMSHAKFLVDGLPTQTSEGTPVNLANGYPDAATVAGVAGITASATDYTLATTATTLTVSPAGATTPASCQWVYTQSTGAGLPPSMPAPTTTGC